MKYHNPQSGDTIAVWFSCGAASAVAARNTIDRYGDTCKIRIINNPIAEEHPDNTRFMRDVEEWLGYEIETAVNPHFETQSCDEVWRKRKFMSGVHGAPCTLLLKKKARQLWEEKNHHDWIVLGFTADEKHRAERFSSMERDNLIPILVEQGVTKSDCFLELMNAGIDLPEIYKLGYPNANCIGCVKASGVTYWNHVRKVHPNVFEQRATLSRELNAKLVRYKGERIFLDELPPDATGKSMKNLDFECGIFCMEK